MSVVAAFIAASSFAQTTSGGFSLSESTVYYGARIGMNISTLTGDVEGAGSKVGLNVGPVVGLRISDATPIFLESGLFFSMQGSKKDPVTTSLNYFRIPVLIKYGFQATDEIAVLPFLGPTIAFGIGGDTEIEGKGSEASFGSGKFNRLDAGIRLGCGAEWNKLYLEMAYEFGIANISDGMKNKTDKATVHNGNFMINFGVNF